MKGNRRRRVRCKNCEACLGNDCRACTYCQDMTKYGGPGRMKQTCEKRRCVHPQLPICAYCEECKLDGWYNEPKLQVKETERPEDPPKLFECTVCLHILHPVMNYFLLFLDLVHGYH
jgi:F-box/leucine-rich repeat protein 10/11